MSIRTLLGRLALSLLLFAGTASAGESVKVVYQFSEGLEQASRGLKNIAHHLDADPTVKIVAVAMGSGVDFLIRGAKDSNGLEYRIAIGDLSLRGVEFRVCNNTLLLRHIERARVDENATAVPAGVAEIANLQAKERFAYIKP